MEGKNLSGVESYLGWLENYLQTIKKHSIRDFYHNVEYAPVPNINVLDEDDPFRQLVEEFELNEKEQLILTLAIAPNYIQEFLNTYFKQNVATATPIPQNGQFVPTVETALDIIAGNNVKNRNECLALFLPGSTLLNESLVNLYEVSPGIYLTKRPLLPSEKVMQRLISGKESKINFSSDFPAVPVETTLNWDDLVLAPETIDRLEEIEEWLKFEKELKKTDVQLGGYRKGYKCLFHGPPGTGKTLAASLIGKLTGKPVYKIDLSAMVSKYIGETEKNLRKVFDKADHGRWILFFDEADSLFGKRGKTQSSNDRYANMEVSYLLQRFELYEGVAILASNFKDNIDPAFNRRFDSIVSFRSPDINERILLWEKHLPKGFVFDEDVNIKRISQDVKLTGAQIHNVMRRCLMKSVLRKSKTILGKDMLGSVQFEYNKENKIF